MRLQFLGTGGYHPNERRHTAGILLPDCGVVFDAGTSLFRLAPRLRTDEIQIFLSHAHLDHIAGLTFLLVPLFHKQIKRARVYSAPEYLQAVREHLFTPLVFPITPSLELLPLEKEFAIAGGGTLTHCRLKRHPGGSIAYRIDWPDRSLAYVTDTTVDPEYADFIRGVDVLIHECYFTDAMIGLSEKTGHSSTTQVAQLARDTGVGKLWLTHIDPQCPEDDPVGLAVARAIFPATEIAEDLLEIDF